MCARVCVCVRVCTCARWYMCTCVFVCVYVRLILSHWLYVRACVCTWVFAYACCVCMHVHIFVCAWVGKACDHDDDKDDKHNEDSTIRWTSRKQQEQGLFLWLFVFPLINNKYHNMHLREPSLWVVLALTTHAAHKYCNKTYLQWITVKLNSPVFTMGGRDLPVLTEGYLGTPH